MQITNYCPSLQFVHVLKHHCTVPSFLYRLLLSMYTSNCIINCIVTIKTMHQSCCPWNWINLDPYWTQYNTIEAIPLSNDYPNSIFIHNNTGYSLSLGSDAYCCHIEPQGLKHSVSKTAFYLTINTTGKHSCKDKFYGKPLQWHLPSIYHKMLTWWTGTYMISAHLIW